MPKRFIGSKQSPSNMNWHKYLPFDEQIKVDGVNRRWPSKTIKQAPRWCSVDLRDGNQALIEPMNNERKLKFWNLLINLGFKEIEVGFPAASETDYNFIRLLIEQNLIPEDVTIGVLTQAREPLIKKTFDALKGAKSAYVHLYNSTSVLQRDVVFKMDKQQIIALAIEGAKLCKSLEYLLPDTDLYYEYSPESFTGTEPEFAAQIANEVALVFGASPKKPVIINLPATVEMTTPNVYADSIEWVINHLGKPTTEHPDDGLVPDRDKLNFTRDDIIVSVHPHNDQGMSVAAAQLALLAGADRIEGCLLGNGERTGNVDLITVALNLLVGGIDPELNIHNIHEIRDTVESCNQIYISERHPYAGSLVFTAFSGSHQDAIKKGMENRELNAQKEHKNVDDILWQVPYIPIDPHDIGATYESVIRINSQSGKGGIAYILKSKHNLDLPKRLQSEFSAVVQKYADKTSKELIDSTIYSLFCDEYLPIDDLATHTLHKSNTSQLGDLDPWGRLKIMSISSTTDEKSEDTILKVKLNDRGQEQTVSGIGNGPLDAFICAISFLTADLGEIQILDYSEHALTSGKDAAAVSYIECRVGDIDLWGVGIDPSTTKAALKAIVSAINRATKAS